MSRKCIAVFFAVVLLGSMLLSVASAASVVQKYCNRCSMNTTWTRRCSGTKAGGGYDETHFVNGMPCNYTVSYYYYGLYCSECDNRNVLTTTHRHEFHDICGNRNYCY